MNIQLTFTIAAVFSLIQFFKNSSQTNNEECLDWMNEHVFISNEIHFETSMKFIQINSFDDLQLPSACPPNQEQTLVLKIYARENILLDNSLDLRGIRSMFNYVEIILFQNIKGFNQKTISNVKFLFKIEIDFENIQFDFYQNNTLIDDKNCIEANFNAKLTNFIGSLTKLKLMENVFYNSKVCPYVFMNTDLEQISFDKITNSLIFKNRLEFLNSDARNLSLNVNYLIFLSLKMAYESLTSRILHPSVYKVLRILLIDGLVEKIDPDLFERNTFKSLRLISFSTQNLKEIFYSGTKWMSHLNKNVRVYREKEFYMQKNLDRSIFLEFIQYEFSIINRIYSFPNEDICLFKNFPHAQLVLPVIVLNQMIECSCTLIWLIQHSIHLSVDNFTSYINEVYTHYGTNFTEHPVGMSVCKGRNFSVMFYECNFTQRFEKCLDADADGFGVSFNLNGFIRVQFLLKWIQYVLGK